MSEAVSGQADNPPLASVLIFDVNETLLDIDSLRAHFDRAFADESVVRTWFNDMVMYSMTLRSDGIPQSNLVAADITELAALLDRPDSQTTLR